MMVLSERAKQARRDAEGCSAAAQTRLGTWHLKGEEGLEQDDVKGGRVVPHGGRARARGRARPTRRVLLQRHGVGPEQRARGEVGAQGDRSRRQCGAFSFVGQIYARGWVGVKKVLPLGKRYLELCAA